MAFLLEDIAGASSLSLVGPENPPVRSAADSNRYTDIARSTCQMNVGATIYRSDISMQKPKRKALTDAAGMHAPVASSSLRLA